ncbi:hypothetical protein S101447_02896 (plasmid) [Acetobacter ascendens]|uniref:Uncharacterized protein n=1 Tax=Acetobacter ascendens TaxID=481146 RepID=A0A1Y0V6A4_9PROT|nr:hypothetical protein S101447_02745 [Acetobacter ascendens]ARW11933.1 hypothetical protein S101447_02896 [Acetobacter ascendens]
MSAAMVRPQAARAYGRAIAPASCLCSAEKGSHIKDPEYEHLDHDGTDINRTVRAP